MRIVQATTLLCVTAALIALGGCSGESAVDSKQPANDDRQNASAALATSAGPGARSNWAVARAGDEVFAFYGLGAGKTHSDIAGDAYAYDLRTAHWRALPAIPVAQGRLASVAAEVFGQIYLFGGYTVAGDGAESSTPEVLRFDPRANAFFLESQMPVPVDDAVAVVWRQRWVVLVSGWHDTGNVSDVQIYDTREKTWIAGTPWPGKPVFGHAGGMVDDKLVVCDGVTAQTLADGKNHFAISDACWQGHFSAEAVGQIDWSRLPAHPGAPLYRSGATGVIDAAGTPRVVFAGGSTRPYNFDGIGYDGQPAQPSDTVLSFDLNTRSWTTHAPLPEAGMDFRGLIADDGYFLLFGGMRSDQQVSDGTIRFALGDATAEAPSPAAAR